MLSSLANIDYGRLTTDYWTAMSQYERKNVTGRGKKILAWLAGVLVLLAALILLSPYWLGLVLPSVLSRAQIRYGQYERADYSHFTLLNVNYSANGTEFHADKVEGFTPIVWLWQLRQTNGAFLRADSWTLQFKKNETTAPTTAFPAELTKSRSEFQQLEKWLGRVELGTGSILLGNERIPVSHLTWAHGHISAEATLPKLDNKVEVAGKMSGQFPWTISATVPKRDLQLNIVLTNSTSVAGDLQWHTNRADFSAVFGSDGMIPERATVDAPDVVVSARDFDLRGYDEVRASLHASWQSNQYTATLHARATPLAASTNLQPFVAELEVRGNTNSATLENLAMTSPGMEAHLSAPLSFNFKGEMLNRSAAFVVKADLSQQRFLPITGLVTGTASLRRRAGTYPEVIFDVSGNRVTGFDIEATRMKTHGQLNWPMLDLQGLNVRFSNGASADITTSVNLTNRFVAHGTIDFSGKLAEDYLPLGYDYERLSLHANFNGPLHTLKHSGELKVGEVIVPYFKTFAASATWSGESTKLTNVQAELRFPTNALVRLSGAGELVRQGSAHRFHADVQKLNIVSADQAFALKTAVRLSAEITKTNHTKMFKAEASSIQLRSTRGDLMAEAALNWPEAGRISLYGHRLDSQVADSFLIRPVPQVHVEQIAASASWSNAPAKWNFDTIIRLVPAEFAKRDTKSLARMQELETPASIRLQAFGDDRGTTITNLNISQKQNAIVSASGVLPMTIRPLQTNGSVRLIHFNDNEPFHFHAFTTTNTAFWDAITGRLPIQLRNPSLQLSLDGTLRDPRGTIRCEIPAGTLKLRTNATFSIANLKANATIDRRQVHLVQMNLLVDGQPLWASGTLPVPENIERDWKKMFDWRTANLQIRANDVEIAPFASLERRYVSPEGTIWANIAINRGKVDGSIVVTNAASRPIAQFGAIRDINAHIKFSQNRIDIEQCSGTLSGGPVAISGWADLSRMEKLTQIPAFVLSFHGDSVPVARRADLIVRTKFDVVVIHTNEGPGIVKGVVGLENSYVLSDLKLFVPPSVAKPQNRPPYFSVDTKPFSEWKLDVNVVGDHFLKVRSPFFNGVCSANMHLGGTLAEPVALGDATINSGEVQFPFATVKVTQGFVTLTAAHPYMPYLFITGTTRAYDFDIRMNVTGPVSAPNIQFTSTPGLPSEQILVMLTTGELPATATALTMQQRTLRVGAFVGKNLLSRLGVSPGSDQRLSIESSRDVSEQNTETYSMEYKINPDWSIIGDYNQFGGVNLGLKWRFFSE